MVDLAGWAPGVLGGLLEPPVPVDAVAACVVAGCLEDEFASGCAVVGPDAILARA